jgi:hypothetical protein
MMWIKYALIAAIVTVVASVLHYTLPQVDVVRIVGTDVKRVDAPQDAGETNTDTGMRTADVYFILAETPGGSVRNYRNEDALLYGKFDSSDLHTRARSISQNEENTVAIRHYGWRLPLFSMFPNATAVWEVEPGYRHLPLFNIAFLALLVGGLGYTAWRIRKIRIRIAEARAERETEAAAEAERKARERAERDAATPDAKDRDKALEDFLGNGSGTADGGGSGGD